MFIGLDPWLMASPFMEKETIASIGAVMDTVKSNWRKLVRCYFSLRAIPARVN